MPVNTSNQGYKAPELQMPELLGQLLKAMSKAPNTVSQTQGGIDENTRVQNNRESPNNAMQQFGQSQVGPYQEGVLKGLKKIGEEHAYNAVSMGADPNQVANHPVMGSGMPQQTDTAQFQAPTGDNKSTTIPINTPNNQPQTSQSQVNNGVGNGSGTLNDPIFRQQTNPWRRGGLEQDKDGKWYFSPQGQLNEFFLKSGAGGGNDLSAMKNLQNIAGKEPQQNKDAAAALNEMINSLPTQMTESQKGAAASIKPLMESRNLWQKATGQRTPEVILTREQLGKAPSATVTALQAKMDRIAELSDKFYTNNNANTKGDNSWQVTPGKNKYKLISK